MPILSRLRPVRVFTAIVLLAALCPATVCPAQDLPAAERAYDIRDLLIDIPDFTDVPQLGVTDRDAAPKPAGEERKARTPEELTSDVVGVVRSLVNLPADSIRVLQGQMAVRATPEAHRTVAAALEQLRGRFAQQVKIEAQMFRPDPAALERLNADAPALALKLRFASFRGGRAAGTGLTADEVGALRQACGGGVAAPHITLFAGQRAYVLTATQRAFVAALVPKRNPAAPKAPAPAPQVREWEPQTKIVQSGVILEGRATPTPDGRFVALAARVSLSTLHGMSEVPAPGVPPDPALTVQSPDYEIDVADVHAVAPDGAFLLFGATQTARPNAPAGADPSPPAYVLLRATAVPRKAAPGDVN